MGVSDRGLFFLLEINIMSKEQQIKHCLTYFKNERLNIIENNGIKYYLLSDLEQIFNYKGLKVPVHRYVDRSYCLFLNNKKYINYAGLKIILGHIKRKVPADFETFLDEIEGEQRKGNAPHYQPTNQKTIDTLSIKSKIIDGELYFRASDICELIKIK